MTTSKILSSVNNYRDKLKKASTWHNSEDSIAYVSITDSKKGKKKEHFNVYEFYCYIAIVHDLLANYQLLFIKGAGKGKEAYKFPQAAANKKGSPRFDAYKSGVRIFQICAGTLVDGLNESENEHPDISFQVDSAGDAPQKEDLIIILDAKYQDDFDSRLSKLQVQGFAFKVNSHFCLPSPPQSHINFDKLPYFFGNCLITNAQSHSDKGDMLARQSIKEVTNFYPDTAVKILP